jgi:poly(A) polymerase
LAKLTEVARRLREADWLLRPETQRLLGLLDGAQYRTRAVGGIVRDTILAMPRDLAEVDFATELLPADVMRRAAAAGIPAYPTGIEHGTVTLRVDALIAEVTTLREDIETDGRHAVVRFGTDWARDAARRDFTLNALYVGQDGTLFDPIGGLDDCLERRVRFIGDAATRIAEDRLRVYRFFRFSASHAGEALDPAGLSAAIAAAPDTQHLARERVGAELRRMLALPKMARTLRVMADAGLVPLSADALKLLKGYESQARRPDLVARLALILVDTDPDALQAAWRLSNDHIAGAGRLLSAARLLTGFAINEAAYRYPGLLSEAVDVAATLAGWTEAAKLALREQLEALQVPRFPISGRDLIASGMPPGPAIGQALEWLERLWIDSSFALGREALLALLKD